MTIEYAILGFLSWQPLSGYDLKKRFVDSTVFYWSGNNNQIYRALVQLEEEGLIMGKVQVQEGVPNKKTYAITEKGRSKLEAWVQSTPKLPELRHAFLIQLTWADLLDEQQLQALLSKYEEEVQVQLLMQQEKAQRGGELPLRTPRERYLSERIEENLLSFYQNELNWVRNLREGLSQLTKQNGGSG
jgi:DNA-binding PadR family transcriptional regulator